MLNRLSRDGQYKCWLAKDLDEAYQLGFFNGSMTRYELMDRLTKHNKSLRWFANSTHRSLWDTDKGERGFICGITHNSIVPRYSIMQYDFSKDKKLTYCNAFGEVTESETTNADEEEYTALARGWEATLAIVERNGYVVDRRGL